MQVVTGNVTAGGGQGGIQNTEDRTTGSDSRCPPPVCGRSCETQSEAATQPPHTHTHRARPPPPSKEQ